MKIRKLLTNSILFLFGFLFPFGLLAQKSPSTDSPEYQRLKEKESEAYSLQSTKNKSRVQAVNEEKLSSSFFRSCKEIIPRDASFQIVPFEVNGSVVPPFYRNDDRSTLAIPLPFNFCFYGTNYDSVFINNNGSISFDAQLSTFIPDSFPTKNYKMIAPFWGDVDTRNLQSGLVYYKITPTHMIVTWDHVGYYDKHADKKNTFQLIITDGNDTLLRPGKNVSFRYDEMQWTTGDIGGTNGFSEPAATVGANFGDSIKFIQFGRFAIAGNDYDGPYDGYDGISWLNGRTFEFSVCSADNIEPIVNNYNFCDTIYSCIGDTVSLDLSFLSPEIDQITSSVVTATNYSGLTIMQNTAGKVNDIKGWYIGNPSNVGTQKITFTATDNGTPPASLQIEFIIKVKPFFDTISVFGADLTICPNSTTPLTASPGFETYKWSNNIVNPSINAPPGNYFVIGRKGNCFVSSDTVSVSAIPVVVPQISGNISTTICKLDSTLLQVTNSFPHYLWSNGDTTQSAYLNGGNAFVTITDTNGCKVKSNNFLIPFFPVYDLTVNGPTAICPLDSGRLVASPGFTNYLWNNGTSDSAIWVGLGNYTVIAIDSNACLTKSDTFNLQSFQIFDPVIFGEFSYCHGDSAEINIHPFYTSFLWNTGDTVSTIKVPQGSYFVTVTDLNNCKLLSDTVTVEKIDSIAIPVTGRMAFCPGDSTTLTAGAGFSNYQWSTGASGTQTVLFPGTYLVTATDSNQCKAKSLPLIVSEFTPIVPLIDGNAFVCPGQQTVLSCPAYFSHLNWSTGDTLNSIQVPIGAYSLLAVDSNNCATSSDTLQVMNFLVSTPLFTGSLFACPNDSSSISTQQSYAHYWWSNGDTTSSVLLPAGTYVLTAVDTNTCTTPSATISIGNYSVTSPQISGNSYCCINDSALLNVGNVYSQCIWSNGLIGNSVKQAPGQYTVWATDSNGCKSTSLPFLLNAFPYQLPVIVGTSFVCTNDSAQLSTSNSYNAYTWTTGNNSASISIPAGSYAVQVVDQNNCVFNSPQFVVQNFPVQVPGIVGKNYCCVGDSVALSVSSGFHNYLWNNGHSGSILFASPGTYSLQALDANNCRSFSPSFMVQNSIPQVAISGTTVLCSGEQTMLQLNQNYPTVLWSNQTTASTTLVNAGDYHVQVWDSIGCWATDSISIASYLPIQLDFSFKPELPDMSEEVFFEPSILLNGNTISNFTWSVANTGTFSNQQYASLLFPDSGFYEIKLAVMTNNGCMDTISKIIHVEKKLIIPNVITPNGDGENDVFEIINLDLQKNTKLQITDRWGHVVFSSNAYQNNWDAPALKNGVYFYTLLVEGERAYHGSFSLLH